MIGNIYEFALYAFLLFGIYLSFKDNIDYLLKMIFWDIQNTKVAKQQGRFMRHIKSLISIIQKKDQLDKNTAIYVIITVALFVGTVLLLLKQKFNFYAIILGFVVAAMPYVYIRSRVALLRISGSFEGEVVISEFINQYKLSGKNIIAAIDGCLMALTENEPISKKAFYKMSMNIKSARTEEDVQRIMDDFVSTTDTVWARTLTNNIFNAYVDKSDITAGLEDLYSDCQGISANQQKVKKVNMEAMAMIKFLGPIFMVGFAYMTKTTVDATWGEIIQYEFNTKTGSLLFILIVVLYFVCIVVGNILVRQKYDI